MKGGTFVGKVPLIIKYLELFIIYVNMNRWKNCEGDDQAYTYFLSNTGMPVKHQIKQKVFIVCIHWM